MKNKTLYSPNNFWKSIPIAIVIVLISAISVAKAENVSPVTNFNSVIDGLFFPTAADKFFEEGRKNFATEVDFLINPDKYFKQDIL